MTLDQAPGRVKIGLNFTMMAKGSLLLLLLDLRHRSPPPKNKELNHGT